jgi:3',5'-nucleoside bisphosphate phosphatase
VNPSLLRIDLHLHTSASDGSLAPDALVAAAVAGKLDVISVTDHDTADGVQPAQETAGDRVRVIPGIEISSTFAGLDLHILGYGIDYEADVIRSYTLHARARRGDRIRGMIERLSALGVTVSYEEVLATAGKQPVNLGRPHLAQAMLKRGQVQTFAEAFDRYLGDGGPACLPIELVTPREAIDLIHSAGGIAVWAHPPADVLRREIDHFAAWGLDGLECYRPRNTPEERASLLALADRMNLIPTGGSDWHGIWHGAIGDFCIGSEQVQKLLLRLG